MKFSFINVLRNSYSVMCYIEHPQPGAMSEIRIARPRIWNTDLAGFTAGTSSWRTLFQRNLPIKRTRAAKMPTVMSETTAARTGERPIPLSLSNDSILANGDTSIAASTKVSTTLPNISLLSIYKIIERYVCGVLSLVSCLFQSMKYRVYVIEELSAPRYSERVVGRTAANLGVSTSRDLPRAAHGVLSRVLQP